MAKIIVQPQVKNSEETYDDLIINNANKVQNVDFSSSNNAKFGQYIIPKNKTIFDFRSGTKKQSITFNDLSLLMGKKLEIEYGDNLITKTITVTTPASFPGNAVGISFWDDFVDKVLNPTDDGFTYDETKTKFTIKVAENINDGYTFLIEGKKIILQKNQNSISHLWNNYFGLYLYRICEIID